MTMILGIDPGPEKCGIALYVDPRRDGDGRVWEACPDMPLADVLDTLREPSAHWPRCDLVAIERVQSCGISGASLLQTSEAVGRLWQAASASGCLVRLVYRREVLAKLDVTGKGSRDVMVRQRLLEMHGGPAAVGKKAAPGPLYGVSGHAWQALAVAVAANLGAGFNIAGVTRTTTPTEGA